MVQQQQQQQQQHSSHLHQSIAPTSRWRRSTQVRSTREVHEAGPLTTLRPDGQRPIKRDSTNELELKSRPALNVINGKLRGQVTLRCSLKPLERDHDEVSLILWYKDSSMVPIFSVDARASPVLEARHKPGTWLEGRSTLRFEEESEDEEDEQFEHGNNNNNNTLVDRRRRRSISDIDEDLAAELRLAQLETESWINSPQVASLESIRGQNRWPVVIQNKANESGRRRRRRRRDETRPKHLVAKLTVDSLSSEDNGFYRCKVDFRRSKSRVQQLELKIVVPAEKPLIRDLTSGSSRVVKNNLAGPHPELARVSLECETSGGYPEPSLTWWRDGILVDDSYELISALDGRVLERRGSERLADNELTTTATANERRQQQQQQSSESPISRQQQPMAMANRLIRNRLELVGLTRDDLLANYSCQASNSKLGDPPTSYVMIDMNLRPIRVQIDNERPAVLAGKPIEVSCRVFGSRPAALVSWHLNKARLVATPPTTTSTTAGGRQQRQQQISESVSSDSNVTTSVLTFTPQVEHSGKLLTCRAENGFKANKQQQLDPFDQPAQEGGGSSGGGPLEDSWKLEVHYLPRVRLALGEKLANRQAVQVGHDVYFECASQAEPPAHELRWWFEGRELETNVTRGVIISNQSLVLQRVSRHQRGRYTCSAVNLVGESRSNAVLLRIQHEPFCRDTHSITSGPASSHKNGYEDGLRMKHTSDGNDDEQQQQQVRTGARHKSVYGVARSESAKVYCHVEADPSEPISYKWAFVATRNQPAGGQHNFEPKAPVGNGPVEWSGQQVVYLNASLITNSTDNNPLISVLNYTPKSELDYGSLLCWARNSLGQQLEPCVYQVVPAEKPEPLRNCRLVNATDSQLAIGCEPGYDGGIDQSFHMEIYEAGRTDQLVANLTNSVGLISSSWLGSKSKLNGVESLQVQVIGSPADTSEESTGSAQDLDLFDSEAQDEPDSENSKTIKTPTDQHQHQLAASLVSESQTSSTSSNSSRQQKQRHSTGQPPGQSRAQNDQAGGGAGSQQANLQFNQRNEAFFLTEPHQLNPATSYLISVYSSNSKGASKPLTFTANTSQPQQQSSGGFSNLIGVRESRRNGGRPSDQSSSALITEVLALSWSPFLLVCAVTVLIFVLFASITFALIKYVDLANLMATGALSSGHSSRMANSQSNASDGNFDAGSGAGGQQATAATSSRNDRDQIERYQKVNGFDKTLVSSNSSTASGTTNSELANGTQRFQRLDHDQPMTQTMTTTTGGEFGGQQVHGQHQRSHHQPARFASATLSRLPATGAQNLPLARVIAIGANGGEWPSQLTSSPLNGRGGELEIPLNGVAALNSKRASLLNGAYLRAKIQQLTGSGQQIQQNQSNGAGRMRHSNSDNFLNQTVEPVALAAASSSKPVESSAQNWFQCRAPHYQAAYWTGPNGGTLPRTLANQSAGQPAQSTGTSDSSYYQLDSSAYGYLKVLGGASSGGRQLASHNHHHHHHHQPVLEHSPGGQQHFVELPPPPSTTTSEGVADSSTSFSSSTAAATATAFVFNRNHVPTSASPAPTTTANCSPLQLHAHSNNNSNSTATTTPMANNNGPVEHLLISGKQYVHQTRPISFNEQQQVQLTSSFGNHQACSSANAATAVCCGQQAAYKQPVLHLPNAIATTATNCCLIVDDVGQLHRHHQQQLQQQSSTPKTSDLGEEDDDDNDDDHNEAECNGLDGAANNHQSAGSSTAFNADLDGMSSQGTQRSSLATTSTHPTSTTLGSPSSGYGPETICDHSATTPVGGGGSGPHLRQHPDQQLVRCNPLKPSFKSAGLRQTRKSLHSAPVNWDGSLRKDEHQKNNLELLLIAPLAPNLFLSNVNQIDYFDHQNNVPLDTGNDSFSYIYNQDFDLDNNLDQTNLVAAAQFYLLQDDNSEPMIMQQQQQHSTGSMSTLVRLANKSRVRLVTPNSQQAITTRGPLDQITACNSVANHHNSQSRRETTQKSQENRPNDGYGDEDEDDVAGDLATSHLDLQTDV